MKQPFYCLIFEELYTKGTMKKAIKKLTSRDVVLGIGRKATNEELEEYLNRPRVEEFKPIQKFREEITNHLRKRNPPSEEKPFAKPTSLPAGQAGMWW